MTGSHLLKIYLDLDDVQVDFQGHFRTVFGIGHRDVPNAQLLDMVCEHPTFYADLPVMPGTHEFLRTISHLDVTVLTACPDQDWARIAGVKYEFVRRCLSPSIPFAALPRSIPKSSAMASPGDILIDDHVKNINEWTAAGGRGILHTSYPSTLAQLETLLPQGLDPTGRWPRYRVHPENGL